MSSSRFPPSRFAAPKPAPVADKDSGNALWRIKDWFKTFDPALLESLRVYHAELLKFNGRLNLISRATEREADEIHFADCYLALQSIPEDAFGRQVFDIGSGNGLPAVVMALMYPNTEFCLVESDSRKCEFIKHICHVLKLKNVQILNVRLETLKAQPMEVATSRGFATISKTVLAVNKCFSKGGRFYHLKGSNWSSEIAEFPSQLISVWHPQLIGEYSLPTSQARRAVVCTTKVQS